MNAGNAVRRVLHVAVRWFTFASIGVGALLLALAVFPTLRTFVHPARRFRRAMRACMRGGFWLAVAWLRLTGLIRIGWNDRERLRAARGMVVMANHPSILDVVILIAATPQPDCIVTARLWANPFMRGVVSSLFISNGLDPDEITEAAARSLAEGNNLIVFPEGTRTVRGRPVHLRRGGAHIALRTAAKVLPVRIDATDPVGLRKGDSAVAAPEDGFISYRISVLEAVEPAVYANEEPIRAARLLTRDVGSLIVSQPTIKD